MFITWLVKKLSNASQQTIRNLPITSQFSTTLHQEERTHAHMLFWNSVLILLGAFSNKIIPAKNPNREGFWPSWGDFLNSFRKSPIADSYKASFQASSQASFKGSLIWFIGSIHCVDSLIGFIISIRWFDSFIRFFDSILWFDSLIRFFDSILWFDSLIRFFVSILCFDSLIRFFDSILCFDSLIRFFVSILWFDS